MSCTVARLTPRILLVWVLLGALVPRLSALRPVYLVNTYALIPLLLAALLLERVLARRDSGDPRPRAADWALALFVLSALGSIALQHPDAAVARREVLELWRTFVVPIAVFWAVRLARPRRSDVAAWAVPLTALAVVEVAVGLLAWFRPEEFTRFWPGSVMETGGVRITGTLPQADVYAAVLVLCAVVLFERGDEAAGGAARWLVAGGVALAFTGVFLSFSRASWLGGLVALCILAAAHRRAIVVPFAATILAVGALSQAPAGRSQPALTSEPGVAGSRPSTESYAKARLGTTRSVTDRIVLDAAGLRMFLRKPLLGWGFGTYDRHARGFVEAVGPFIPSDWATNLAASHCTHLSILAEVGLLGYALLTFPAAQLAKATLGRRVRRGDRTLAGLWAFMAFLGVTSVLVDLRYVAPAFGLAGLVLGLIAVRVGDDEPEL
jgi:O-antigen ligase